MYIFYYFYIYCVDGWTSSRSIWCWVVTKAYRHLNVNGATHFGTWRRSHLYFTRAVPTIKPTLRRRNKLDSGTHPRGPQYKLYCHWYCDWQLLNNNNNTQYNKINKALYALVYILINWYTNLKCRVNSKTNRIFHILRFTQFQLQLQTKCIYIKFFLKSFQLQRNLNLNFLTVLIVSVTYGLTN